MKQYKMIVGFLVACSLVLFSGCYKNSSIVSETGDEITREVSFSNDIIPIMNNSCSVSSCHTSGGKTPDLSESNAYRSLINGEYINVSDPLTSQLYLWMTGKKGTPMPVSGINKDYNALVVAWIKQGALNN
jgi:hypothetical protein